MSSPIFNLFWVFFILGFFRDLLLTTTPAGGPRFCKVWNWGGWYFKDGVFTLKDRLPPILHKSQSDRHRSTFRVLRKAQT